MMKDLLLERFNPARRLPGFRTGKRPATGGVVYVSRSLWSAVSRSAPGKTPHQERVIDENTDNNIDRKHNHQLNGGQKTPLFKSIHGKLRRCKNSRMRITQPHRMARLPNLKKAQCCPKSSPWIAGLIWPVMSVRPSSEARQAAAPK